MAYDPRWLQINTPGSELPVGGAGHHHHGVILWIPTELEENSMNDVALTLLAGSVSAVISAVVTYIVTRLKVRLDLMVEYDKKLRAERLDAYKELWKLLKPLARFSPAMPLTYQIIQSTSESMRDWYFDVGGIYLSRESRKPYFDLKESLQDIIDNKFRRSKLRGIKRLENLAPRWRMNRYPPACNRFRAASCGVLDPHGNKDLQKDKGAPLGVQMNYLLEQGTKLRNSLSDDIGTRRGPFV